ncbi:MAG: threonylcarbamoyl-AMP synthase [Candidatus Odinarchaeum yellowstonii]|uniref:L-threonylcarbamoyladenylate synthase n=1 Tax=Odinarchaeota yellowstonii (strain LCB_4) TaxID=1841599 RepID=A0AAF0D174_ODILC|nr:MAG: threonylcarbamoyl-AMP synthase [Candidatus Odinarchaeum yellowstonii]
MKIVKVDSVNPDLEILREAAEAILRGCLVAYPTDTLYGLCTNPFSEDAVRRLFSAKRRSLGKGLPILVENLTALKRIAYVNQVAAKLIEKFWPGALTIIVDKRNVIPDIVTGGSSVAVRMPDSKITLKLAGLCGGFLIGTSANISGSIKQPDHVEVVVEELGDAVDLILDGGKTGGLPSTIVDVREGLIKVIREGAIPSSILRV